MKKLCLIPLFAILLIALSSCSSDSDYLSLFQEEAKTQINLTFVIPNTESYTRAEDGYEEGIGSENLINVADKDYKIYFFSYEGEGDETPGTLLAEFTPTRTTSSSNDSETLYTVTGVLPNNLLEVSSFRVVVLANWDNNYLEDVTIGQTTIDDLTKEPEGTEITESTYSTFSASDKFTIDEDHHIPFYGVQEFSDVKIKEGETTTLSTPISLLRALAKVEVIMLENSYFNEFDGVSIVNYNSQGYCAPWEVYSSKDYHADDYSNIGPDDDDWSSVFTNLHLVGGANDSNDSETKTQSFTRVSDATQDTWYIYVPEYDNITNAGTANDDYSYITVTVNGTPYEINFAEYDSNGKTDNTNRYNLKRNNLYRFYVTINEASEESVSVTVRVYVNPWQKLGEETFEF